MVVWKMIFLFQGCILRFHVNLPGCMVFNHSHIMGWSSLQLSPGFSNRTVTLSLSPGTQLIWISLPTLYCGKRYHGKNWWYLRCSPHKHYIKWLFLKKVGNKKNIISIFLRVMFRKIENHPHKGYLSQTPVYKRVFSCQQDRNTLRSTLQTQIPNFYQFTRLQSNQEPTYPATLSPKNHGFSGKLRPGHGKWRGAPCLPKGGSQAEGHIAPRNFPT